MINKDNWVKIKEKYIEFWARENHDRPLVWVEGTKSGREGKKAPPFPKNIEVRWLDTGYIIKSARDKFDATYFGGEAYPLLWPNLGPDIIGAILGCKLHFAEDTSWVDHDFENWEDLKTIKFDPSNKWWKKLVEITEEAVKDAKGEYFVGITDLHPGADALSALRGPERLCMDLYEEPEIVKKANLEVLDVFKQIMNESYAITSRNLAGSATYAPMWHPGKWYAISNDFSCMISREMFKEFFVDELIEEMKFLDASIYHLDGITALHHLDTLLSIPELGGIQWIPGAGNPQGAHWIPMLQKIQKAGKLIQHFIPAAELDVHLENLAPEGVIYFITDCQTEEDAKEIMKKVEKSFKRTFF